MNLKQIHIYSWENLRADASLIGEKIGKGKFKFILAITSNGLIPAYFISEKLGIKVVKTICLSSFKGRGNLRGPVVHSKVAGFLETIENPRDWLVVDAVSDSGHTLGYIKREYPSIKVAVLIQKRTGGLKADYYGREVDSLLVKMPYE